MIRNVFDGLHVGDALDARDSKLLFDSGIRAVVDVAANEVAAQLLREIVYCRFPLLDGDGNEAELLRIAVETVVRLVKGKYRTLVACSAGMSRSPCVAAMASAILSGTNADECLRRVVENGPHDVSPLLWKRVKEVFSTGWSG